MSLVTNYLMTDDLCIFYDIQRVMSFTCGLFLAHCELSLTFCLPHILISSLDILEFPEHSVS